METLTVPWHVVNLIIYIKLYHAARKIQDTRTIFRIEKLDKLQYIAPRKWNL